MRLVFFIALVLLASCNTYEPGNQNSSKSQPKISTFLDSFNRSHPDFFKNDITIESGNKDFVSGSDSFIVKGDYLTCPYPHKV